MIWINWTLGHKQRGKPIDHNVQHRQALDLPDGAIANTLENRLKIAAVVRQLRPRVVNLSAP